MPVSLPFLLVSVVASIGFAFAVPAINSTLHGERLSARNYFPPSISGYSSSYFYIVWGGSTGFVNQGPGTFNVSWGSDIFDTTGGGLGWNPGSNTRLITYDGTYQPNGGDSYLYAYGWTRNPLVEYYIVESYSTVRYNPASGAQRRGTVTCNGANYDILSANLVNQGSIDAIQTYVQYWSVRNPKRDPGGSISGQIDFGCHVNAWNNVGMSLGSSHVFQVVTVLGYSSGSARLTISES